MERLQILWLTSSDLNPGAGIKPHSHPYFHMFHVASGTFDFTAGGKIHIMGPGCTLLVPPNIEHSYTNNTQDYGKYLEIKFTAPDASAEALAVQTSEDPLSKLLFEQIIKEYSELGSLADDAATAYLRALLEILGKDQRYQKQPRQFQHVEASGYNPLSQRVIRYLEDHYMENLSLDALANITGYNKSYLCVAFKKDTRQTILDCLNMIRIRKAAELIVYSDLSLTQVSELCGFSSVSHFNRVFLKYAGITPGQCRRAYPANILFGFRDVAHDPAARQQDYFMYSVLAQKRISLDAIAALDKKDRPSD